MDLSPEEKKDGIDNTTEDASINKLISLGSACIAEINGMFFLLLEVGLGPSRTVLVIRITANQATALLQAGIRRCPILNTIPTTTKGTLICAFVVGENVFLVFIVCNTIDRIVLVRVPLCTIIGGTLCQENVVEDN